MKLFASSGSLQITRSPINSNIVINGYAGDLDAVIEVPSVRLLARMAC